METLSKFLNDENTYYCKNCFNSFFSLFILADTFSQQKFTKKKLISTLPVKRNASGG